MSALATEPGRSCDGSDGVGNLYRDEATRWNSRALRNRRHPPRPVSTRSGRPWSSTCGGEAARVIDMFLPSGVGANHMTVRRLAEIADQVEARDNASPPRMNLSKGGPLIVSLDGAHIRAVPGFQTRHFEVTIGRVDAKERPARHFAAAPNVSMSRPPDTIRNALRAQGWLPGREVIVLSDGDPALVGAVRTPVRGPVTHILDWFHIPCVCVMSGRRW